MLLWYVANLLLVVVALTVVLLANRVITFAREAARYVDDVLVHSAGLRDTLDGLPALEETARLSSQVAAGLAAHVDDPTPRSGG